MPISKEARSVAVGVCDALARDATIVKSSGIDKKKWKSALAARMKRDEKSADRVIGSGARQAYYDAIVEARIRLSKDAAVENLRDLDAMKKALKEQNQLVQIQGERGDYRAKPLKACTPVELDTLAEYHRRKERGHGRRASFYERLALQMRLAGLADDDPLSRLLG